MSGGQACRCSEARAPILVPTGSNERRRQWQVTQYRCNHSAFNGYHYTPSAYSSVVCRVCGASWRTGAAYVDSLEMVDREAYLAGVMVPSREEAGL